MQALILFLLWWILIYNSNEPLILSCSWHGLNCCLHRQHSAAQCNSEVIYFELCLWTEGRSWRPDFEQFDVPLEHEKKLFVLRYSQEKILKCWWTALWLTGKSAEPAQRLCHTAPVLTVLSPQSGSNARLSRTSGIQKETHKDNYAKPNLTQQW